jgi:hypothetical protein
MRERAVRVYPRARFLTTPNYANVYFLKSEKQDRF